MLKRILFIILISFYPAVFACQARHQHDESTFNQKLSQTAYSCCKCGMAFWTISFLIYHTCLTDHTKMLSLVKSLQETTHGRMAIQYLEKGAFNKGVKKGIQMGQTTCPVSPSMSRDNTFLPTKQKKD